MRAARQAGDERDETQQHGDGEERDGIGRVDVVQQPAQQPGRQDREEDTRPSPSVAMRIPCPTTRPMTSRRVAPRAVRTPISRVRCATVPDSTP